MIELKQNQLIFSFADVHPEAKLAIEFQRTLRIPDDNRTYPLPPGLGHFPLEHVDDFERTVPSPWLQRGGVLLPMYQSEALWINFSGHYVPKRGVYPFAVKIATGKINAVTGESWSNGLRRGPQDYITTPRQPWLDGYCVEQGTIRQFVAMPLGEGFTAEEQITGTADYGGLQIIAYPLTRTAFEQHFPERDEVEYHRRGMFAAEKCCLVGAVESAAMGLAPGGKMRQEIYDDPYQLDEWADTECSRCFVHICNSAQWQMVTGQSPPTSPVTAQDYAKAGLPWFEYYGDPACTVKGSKTLSGLKSVADKLKGQGQQLSNNESVGPQKIVVCGSKTGVVRESELL